MRKSKNVSILALGALALSSFACSGSPDERDLLSSEAVTIPPLVYAVSTGSLVTTNGLCFDVKGAGVTPGTPVDVWTCNGTPAQRLTFWSNGALTGPGGQCLELQNASTGALDMNACNGSANQRWALRGQHVVGPNPSGATKRCLATPPGGPTANQPAVLGTCDGGQDLWTLATQPTTLLGIDGHCLDLWGGTGPKVDATTCNGTQAQSFHFTPQHEVRTASGLCLDVLGANAAQGGIDVTTCNGSAAQKWTVSGRQIRSWLGGCLDVLGGSSAPSATVDLATCNGTQAQQWLATQDYSEGMATLLIVTDDTMRPTLQPLVTHKTSTGMPTALVTVADLRALACPNNTLCPPSLDPAAIVKRGIDYYYRYRGTKYVLLAGGEMHVPIRYSELINGDNVTIGYRSNDLYYSNLYLHAAGSDIAGGFASWDGNGNGLYNEAAWNTPAAQYNPDGVDGYPDVAVGRIDVDDTTSMATYVKKVVRYETTNMTSSGNATFFEDERYGTGDTLAMEVANDLDNPGVQHYFTVEHDPSKPVPSPFTASSTDPYTVEWAASNSGWIFYVGHGSPTAWGYNSNVVKEAGPSTFDNMAQSNLPIVFAAACQTGTFSAADINASYPKGTPAPKPAPYTSFSDYWLTHTAPGATAGTGGAIAYAGETVVMQDEMSAELFKYIAGHYSAGERTLGDMWRAGEQDYWHNNLGTTTSGDAWQYREPRIYLGIMTFFGDPSLRVQRGNGPVR